MKFSREEPSQWREQHSKDFNISIVWSSFSNPEESTVTEMEMTKVNRK